GKGQDACYFPRQLIDPGRLHRIGLQVQLQRLQPVIHLVAGFVVLLQVTVIAGYHKASNTDLRGSEANHQTFCLPDDAGSVGQVGRRPNDTLNGNIDVYSQANKKGKYGNESRYQVLIEVKPHALAFFRKVAVTNLTRSPARAKLFILSGK